MSDIANTLNGIVPGAAEWVGSSIYNTWYREQGDWCAMVSPGELHDRPGWDVDVWLRKFGPLDFPASRIKHDHVTSGSPIERTVASLPRALKRADTMLAESRRP